MVVTTSKLATEEWQADDAFEPLTFEKVVGLNNLLRIAWLSRGLELAAPVCRIVTPRGMGSGFLIANDLVLTNHHVFPDAQAAEQSTLEFNYQLDWSGAPEPVRRFTLDGSRFHTNADLDYAIMGVEERAGDLYGFVDLGKRAEATVNDFVTVIQHPLGGFKQICFTDNKVSAVFGHLMQYATDTEPGSSGSPVFDQQWQIVGLHHRGGGLAGPDGKKYFTNEGILISAVLRDAAAFLGIPDTLYDFAFSDLRSQLVGLIDASQPPTDVDALTTELLRTLPRFSTVLDDWSQINGRPGDSPPQTLAVAGVAIGAAMRQWARSEGHESIAAPAATDPPPGDALVAVVSRFSGSPDLPRDVYTAILESLSGDPTPIAGIVAAAGADEGLAGGAKAFMRAVAVGAKAYDPVPDPAAPDRAPAAADPAAPAAPDRAPATTPVPADERLPPAD
jgi:V8-like Glu-specific endopeptidase